jgi:hypothetical protein
LSRIETTQAAISSSLILNAPANGLATATQLFSVNGESHAWVSLFDRKQVANWLVKLTGPNDPLIAEVVETATKNPEVDAVKLNIVAQQVFLASDVDPERSFLIRGNVEVCRNSFKEKYGQPVVTELLGAPPTTGRDFVTLPMGKAGPLNLGHKPAP